MQDRPVTHPCKRIHHHLPEIALPVVRVADPLERINDFTLDEVLDKAAVQGALLLKIVEDSLMKTMSWLLSEKINYGHKV